MKLRYTAILAQVLLVAPILLANEETGEPSFGPVTERVVYDDSVKYNVYINLDNGRLFARPRQVVGFRQNMDWFREQGIDALCDTDPLVAGLVGMDMVIQPMPERVWETMGAKELAHQELWTFAKPGFPVYVSVRGELPTTYIFRTREDGMGVLQIVGFTDDPPGVRIRHKMVQQPPTRRTLVSGISLRERVDTDPSPELQAERDKLLAEAETQILQGLTDLAEQFPHLERSTQWQTILRPLEGSPGWLRITLYHYMPQFDPDPTPERERFRFAVDVRPPPPAKARVFSQPLYPNLGLVGHIDIAAGDPKLDASLKEVVENALLPLKELEEGAARTNTGLRWGEAVDGVQVGLRVDRTAWQSGETPTVTVEVRNRGERHLGLYEDPASFELEVDG